MIGSWSVRSSDMPRESDGLTVAERFKRFWNRDQMPLRSVPRFRCFTSTCISGDEFRWGIVTFGGGSEIEGWIGSGYWS